MDEAVEPSFLTWLFQGIPTLSSPGPPLLALTPGLGCDFSPPADPSVSLPPADSCVVRAPGHPLGPFPHPVAQFPVLLSLFSSQRGE